MVTAQKLPLHCDLLQHHLHGLASLQTGGRGCRSVLSPFLTAETEWRCNMWLISRLTQSLITIPATIGHIPHNSCTHILVASVNSSARGRYASAANTSLAASPSPPGRSSGRTAKPRVEGGEGLANIALDHVSLECQLHVPVNR